MVDTHGGGLYGVVAQPLTGDYLAAQLPIFQPKVPTSSQPNLQFATNSPLNLPLPPLYPGEIIKLQQHRVVCVDSFSEPAVGAVYVTNFRIIFYGNLISDPESIDDFQDSHRKPHTSRREAPAPSEQPPSPAPLTKLKFKPFLGAKGEPSFKSFLTGGSEQDSPKESAPITMPAASGRSHLRMAKSHTQRLRSGLKKMSLRRSPQHRKKAVPRSLPTDLVDGRPKDEGGDQSSQVPDISPVSSKISLSSLDTPGSQPNATSLETISLSSASEFSATGTDERSMSSPLGDGESSHSGTIDILADRIHLSGDSPRTGLSDSPSDMSLETTDGYFLTSSVNVEVRKPKPLKVSTLPRMGKRQWLTRDTEQQPSISLLSPPVKPLRDLSKRSRANASVHSIVEPESDSDTENEEAKPKDLTVPQSPKVVVSRSSTMGSETLQEESHSRSGTLRGSEGGGSQESLVGTSAIPSASPAASTDAATDVGTHQSLTEREVASKAEVTPADSTSVTPPDRGDDQPLVESSPACQESISSSDLSQVNRARSNSNSKCSLPVGSGLFLRHSSTSPFKPVVRNRSASSSPQVKKKPKPLPRLSIKKFDSNDLEKREALFVSSLPADFKPTPVSRSLKQKETTSKEVLSEMGEISNEDDAKLTKVNEDVPATSISFSESDQCNSMTDSRSGKSSEDVGSKGDVADGLDATSKNDPDALETTSSDADASCSINNSGNAPYSTGNGPACTGIGGQDSTGNGPHSIGSEPDSIGNGPESVRHVIQENNNVDDLSNTKVYNGKNINSEENQQVDPNSIQRDSSSVAVKQKTETDGATGKQLPESDTSLGFETQNKTFYQTGSSGQSSGDSGCMSPTDFTGSDPSVALPVRPPRRKRNSKIKKESISLPLTPDHTPVHKGANRAPSSSSCDTTSCDQSPVHTSATISEDFVMVQSPPNLKDHSSDSINSKSCDHEDSESSRSQQDMDGSNDKSQELTVNMLFQDEDEPLSPLMEGLRNAPTRGMVHKQLENRASQNSMTANVGSTPTISSGLLRPYSMMLSGDESFINGGERSSEFFSGAGRFSLPRQHSNLGGMALEWNHHQALEYKHSVKLSPSSTRYSLSLSFPVMSIHSVRKLPSVQLKEHNNIKLPEGVLIMCRNFHSLRLHVHPFNTYDADSFKELLERKFLSQKPLHDLFAFQYRAAIRHPNPNFLQNRSLPNFFRLAGEMSRLGLQNVPLWNVRRILADRPDLCPSYPSHVIVPSCMGDLDLIRGASLYKESRFPTLTWYNSHNGAALLRAAGTKEERGQFSSSLQTDEAMLQAISGCKLNHTGPAVTVHIFTEKPEYGLKERNAEQVRTYYYHNCKFNYASNPATFKNIRHSFNKLQALLENRLPDEDYFLAMDSTQWLPRISALLSTSFEVCQSLKVDGDHVLVCYECGWDRTTQVVSLAQLLMDPYYRTMDGFQVLVQKEWVWFGHPFRTRHSRFSKVKEDGPVFLQWADCVWQVMQQCPSAFEFNERLLIAMVEHSYSGLFGTFMTNNEGDRKKIFSEKGYEHISVSSHTISFWMWLNMVNAARRTFYNEIYDSSSYADVIEPHWNVPCLKLWSSHYCKFKPKERHIHTPILQAQLEGLQKQLKELEVLHADLSPALHSSKEVLEKDDFRTMSIQSTTSTRSRGNSTRPPAPPPKPTAMKTYKYESLEEFLTQEGYDVHICKQLSLGQTSCQGNLFKLGAKRKNWLQRWFVLDFECQYLAYFENQQAYTNKDTPKGVIRLGEITRVFQDVKKRDHLVKHIFMVATPHRTYQMQAPSITSMYIWMACLELPTRDLRLGSS